MRKREETSTGDCGSSVPHNSRNSEAPSPQPFTAQPSSAVSIPKPTREKTAIRGTSLVHNSDPLDPKDDGDTDSTVPSIEFSQAELASLRAPWKQCCLIARVIGKRLRLPIYHDYLCRLWSPEGTLRISELGYDFFLIKFSLSLDCEKVLAEGPWMIQQHYIDLRPWIPDFKPSKATTTLVKLWVDFPELPIEYQQKQVLMERIGAAIGKPVKIHHITESQGRLKFARLCVEMDLKQPLPSEIALGKHQQEIRYVGHVGHLQQDLSPRTPCPDCRLYAQTKRNSRTLLDPQVPYQKGSPGNELASSGSGLFEDETPKTQTAESKPAKGESVATTSASPDPIGKNSRPSGSVGRKQHLQPEEGASSSAMKGKASFTPAEETLCGCSGTSSEPKVSQDSYQQPQQRQASPPPPSPTTINKNPTPREDLVFSPPEERAPSAMKGETSFIPAKETLIGCSRTPSEPKVSQDSFQQPQQQQASPPPSSPTTINKNPTPREDLVFSPPQEAPFVASSQIPNSDSAANTSFNSNLHQRPGHAAASPTFSLYSRAMQQATELQDIKNTPENKMEPSTSEASQKAFGIKRTPVVFNIDPTISNIEIGVSNIGQFSSIAIIPTATNHTVHQNLNTNPESHGKKLLSWNCGGAGDLKFRQAMKGLIELHNPSIVVLTDPKTCGADANGIVKEIGFSADSAFLIDEIWVLWQKDDVHVEVTPFAQYQINASVQLFPEPCDNYRVDDDIETFSQPSGMPYGLYDNIEIFSQPSGPSTFYT